MGVDLSCIVKNDFRDRKHKRACEDYINATIEKLSEQYCVEKDVLEWNMTNLKVIIFTPS